MNISLAQQVKAITATLFLRSCHSVIRLKGASGMEKCGLWACPQGLTHENSTISFKDSQELISR